MEDNKQKIALFIDYLLISIIGFFCLLYSIFASNFAESKIQFPFLNFPIFIGEILLGICVVLFIVKCFIYPLHLKEWHYLLFALYISFILLKTLSGYLIWGPLALRNAALFYYPIFAVVAYYLIETDFFDRRESYFATLFFMMGVIFLRLAFPYFRYTYLILGAILILKIKNKRASLILLLLFILFFPYKPLYTVSRGVLIAEVIAILFFVVVLVSKLRLHLIYKLFSLFALSLFLIFQVFLFANDGTIKSLSSLNIFLKGYNSYKEIINAKKDKFKAYPEITVRIYEPGYSRQQTELQEEEIRKLSSYTNKTSIPKEMLWVQKYEAYRGFAPPYRNVLWRIFVWQDMLQEFLESKNYIWGLDFGKPFRSKSVEILGWDAGLGRVGWVEPHNSYIHIFYRSGIIGLLFITGIWICFINTVKTFIGYRNTKGVLLSSVLLYWLIVANSAVVLELPYFAIPFWSLFGLTLKYSQMIKIKNGAHC